MTKAAILTAPGTPLSIESVVVDKPGPHEVLIRTVACGLCRNSIAACLHAGRAEGFANARNSAETLVRPVTGLEGGFHETDWRLVERACARRTDSVR